MNGTKRGGRCAKKNQACAIVTALLGQAGPFLCTEYAVNPMGDIKGRIKRPALEGKMDSRCGKPKMPYLRGGKRTSNAIAKQESPIAHGWAYEYNTEYSAIVVDNS